MDKYSIEVIEMICEEETDGNAQVTSPMNVTEEIPQETNAPMQEFHETEGDFPMKSPKMRVNNAMQTNAATNWLLFGIFCLLFLFMIFKCD
jgi:hypothetical protein